MNPRQIAHGSPIMLLSACEEHSQSMADERVAKWRFVSVSRSELDLGLQQPGRLPWTQRDSGSRISL